ncbi:hypothetical protein FO519_007830 [Halicephalobus sp. NKZ332]|nr:hypothetical protein FO519_007830 [Halicephalobus sp. NKZ332]
MTSHELERGQLSSGENSTNSTPKHTSSKTLEGALAMIVQNQMTTDSCFCGTKLPSSDKRIFCNSCKVAGYCSSEHQEADSLRHKAVCKILADKKLRVNRLDSNSKSETASLESAYSSKAPSLEDAQQIAMKIFETDDPEVQIIETNTPKINPETKFSRKRAHNPHITYKDHAKNPLFKSTLQDHMRTLAASGLALNQHQAIALRLRYLAEHVIRGLNEYGWAVCDHFLGDTHCQFTYREVERLFQRGLFSAGQLMDRKENTSQQDIRSDQIYWFDGSDERARDSVTVRLLISMIDSVIVHFKDRIPPYTISGRSRAMIACYPGSGTRYVKHVDNPVKDGRCITSIYYCNDNWKLAEHGGTLRLYPETSLVPMDIDPQADRLVFFWSDRRNPHEVLPVFRHSPVKSKPSGVSEWQSRPSAFKTVATSAFVPPKVPENTPIAGSSASSVKSEPFRPPVSHMNVIRDSTNSDSFSTGSGEELDETEERPQQTSMKPEYQI